MTTSRSSKPLEPDDSNNDETRKVGFSFDVAQMLKNPF